MTGIIGALGGMFPVASLAVSLGNANVLFSNPDPGDAEAYFSLTNAGAVQENLTPTGTWLISGNAAACEVRATLTSGTFSSGTAATWLGLGTTRTWTAARTTVGSKTCTATFEIRAIANPGTILATATVTLTATVEP